MQWWTQSTQQYAIFSAFQGLDLTWSSMKTTECYCGILSSNTKYWALSIRKWGVGQKESIIYRCMATVGLWNADVSVKPRMNSCTLYVEDRILEFLFWRVALTRSTWPWVYSDSCQANRQYSSDFRVSPKLTSKAEKLHEADRDPTEHHLYQPNNPEKSDIFTYTYNVQRLNSLTMSRLLACW